MGECAEDSTSLGLAALPCHITHTTHHTHTREPHTLSTPDADYEHLDCLGACRLCSPSLLRCRCNNQERRSPCTMRCLQLATTVAVAVLAVSSAVLAKADDSDSKQPSCDAARELYKAGRGERQWEKARSWEACFSNQLLVPDPLALGFVPMSQPPSHAEWQAVQGARGGKNGNPQANPPGL